MSGPESLFAYGPAPGMELIPYFLAMLVWAVLAVLGILLSPFTAVYRRLRGRRPAPAPAAEPAAAPAPEAPGDGPPAAT